MVPTGSQPVAEVVVDHEREAANGWVFGVLVRRPGSTESRHDVSLSWVDYEHWSHGAAAPERVARAVVECLLASAPDRTLPSAFDASTARRWDRGLDEAVRSSIGPGTP
ncbi:MAG: hypothetical protein ACK4WH_10570 [Phycisphaerales bacterium]